MREHTSRHPTDIPLLKHYKSEPRISNQRKPLMAIVHNGSCASSEDAGAGCLERFPQRPGLVELIPDDRLDGGDRLHYCVVHGCIVGGVDEGRAAVRARSDGLVLQLHLEGGVGFYGGCGCAVVLLGTQRRMEGVLGYSRLLDHGIVNKGATQGSGRRKPIRNRKRVNKAQRTCKEDFPASKEDYIVISLLKTCESSLRVSRAEC